VHHPRNVASADLPPERFHLGHRPALDGVRGVAIVLVLLVHLGIIQPQFAFIGVDIFFVLSGFLITALLMAEWEISQDLSLKRFYCRRALRLLPGLMAMLVVCLLYLSLTSPWKVVGRNLVYALRALFYGTNWAMISHLGERSNHLFNHTWSLSIEEQFYFLWPAMILVALRATRSRTSLLWLVLLAAMLSCLVRIVLVTLDESSFWRFYCGLDTRADSLLLGCCAGMIISSNLLPRRCWIEPAFNIAAAISMLGLYWLAGRQLHDPWMYCVGWFLTSVFAVVIVLQLVIISKSPWHGLLESRPLVYIGKISYGLYLWHHPIFYVSKTFYGSEWRYAAVPITVAVTLGSYYLIERPCLQLKRRFEVVA
jgi:peptidoglycan/LPS O-acetylase OafA/YrhL